MKTDKQELKRQALDYILKRENDGYVQFALSEVAEWFKVSLRTATQVVNAIEKDGHIEFDVCCSSFGGGDYLNRYRVC